MESPDKLLEEKAFTIYEDGKEIDLTETAYFVGQAENFELEVVLVLDFTNSMKVWGGIPPMLDGAKAAIDTLGGLHRIGVVEYHDRNFEPSTLPSPFPGLIADKAFLQRALDEFVSKGYLSGSSLCWDAVYKGLSLFTPKKVEEREGRHIVRAMVFLSDGIDTSSARKPQDLIREATALKAQIYVVGVGKAEEAILKQIGNATGGAYYKAPEVEQLTRVFETISADLRGQYIVRYVTLSTVGKHDIKYTIKYQDASAAYEVKSLDLGSLFVRGGDLVGRVTVDSVPIFQGQAETFVRALHIPREVDSIRFKIDTPKRFNIYLPPHSEGGLLEGWEISGPDATGFYRLSAPSPNKFLLFGDAGILFKVRISNITESFLRIPLTFDSSMYKYGQQFDYPLKSFVVGNAPPPKKYDFNTRVWPSEFTMKGDWIFDSTAAYEGGVSIRPAAIGDDRSSELTLKVNWPDEGKISFAYKVSCELDSDLLRFIVDGRPVRSWSGEVNWTKFTFLIAPGEHTFTWAYTKDSFGSRGADTAWIDLVELGPLLD